jgi:polyisoprenyl-phosphate glycosyltransferase
MSDAHAESPRQPALLSIVIPVYNEEGNIEALIEGLKAVLPGIGLPYEVILIDDGSADGTWPLIAAAAGRDPHVTGASLSRNFGHQNAIFAGLHIAKGDVIVTMDGDLQHPPALIPELLARWRAGFNIVETRRTQSADVPVFKALTSRLFYRAFSTLSGIPMSEGTSDFRLIDRMAADAILGMRDADLFLRGISHWVGFRRTTVPYQAAPRHSGRTKYSLSRMLRFAAASLLSFSLVPLKFGIWLGLATSALAFLELIYIIVRYSQGNAVPGWASMLTVVSFMFGILFILVGVLGAYVGSIFQTVQHRPRFLIEQKAGRRLDE